MPDLRYQAFLSYSRQSDARLASSLCSSLSQFAKPWYRLRTVRVFQDKSSLAANPDLWGSIVQALAQSEHLLLLASPASAQSPWVRKEVEWWLQNRTPEKLIIALTEGVIRWDEHTRDFDWKLTNALPSSLQGALKTDPLRADFRAAKTEGKYGRSNNAYRSALLDVAAPLMGRPKDELDSAEKRAHDKNVRTAWVAASLITVLAFSTVAALIEARQRKIIAASRAMASEATSQVDDRSLAMLLSIESRRIADTVESRRSLLTTIQRLPNVEAFLWGHTDFPTRAVFSPDGQTVLSAGWDNRIVLWNATTHQRIDQPIPVSTGLVSVAFSPDGSRFASSASGSIVIWDAKSRRPLAEPLRAEEDFNHVAFSADGKLVAASTEAYGGRPSHVYVWDLATNHLMDQPIPGSNFAFSPDNKWLAIARYEDLVLYDLRAHREVGAALTGHAKNISSIVFSQDGATVAAGAEDKTILLWDVPSRKPLGTLTGQAGTVNSLLFDHEGEILLSGSTDGTIMRWDVDNVKAIDTPVRGFGDSISSIFLTADGHLRALALSREKVIALNVNDDPPLGRRIRAPGIGSSTIDFSPDGRFLASAGESGDVLVWDVASGEQSGKPLDGHDREVLSLAYSPDGKVLASASLDGAVILWDTGARKALGSPMKVVKRFFPVWTLAWSPDGKTVAAGADATLVFWDRATLRQAAPPITSQKDRIWSLAYSPDGKLLASAGNNCQVAIWKMGNQVTLSKTLGTPSNGEFELTRVGTSFSPDGKLLATATRDHSVTIWNAQSGQQIPPILYGHTQAVSGVAFSRDGKILASGSADGDIRLWDLATHELLGTLDGRQDSVQGVVFSSRNLASVGEDNSIVFWDADPDAWVSEACRIANRNLTHQEWKTYEGSSPYRKTCPDL